MILIGFLASAACAAEPIRVVETRVVPGDAVAATHALTLHAYLFSGSRWSVSDATRAVTSAAALLGQCDIALVSVQAHTIDAPRRFRDYETRVSRELVSALPIERPALFFVEDTKNTPAFDAEAIGLSNSRSRPELANTVWIAYGARYLAYVVAHELVHVLADSGAHSTEPRNLMQSETAPGNDRLTPAQCALIRSRGTANGLLAP